MTTVLASTPLAAPQATIAQVTGIRKNGKQWHEPKKAFRMNAGQTTYEKRAAKQAQEKEVKTMENEMKAEKEAERQV
jgi:rRNA-processing protein CGR1